MRTAHLAFRSVFSFLFPSPAARTYGAATLVIAIIALPGSLRASPISFNTYSGWKSDSAGALTSFDFSAFPGNSNSDSLLAGVAFTRTISSGGGTFPSSCSGSGGYLIGCETIADTFPADPIATLSITGNGNRDNYSARIDGSYEVLATPETGTATMMSIGIGLIAAARIRR